MACTVQTRLNAATLPQQRTPASSQRRVGAPCTAHKRDERTRCSIAYGASASHQLQISAKSYFSGTSLRSTVKRPAALKRSNVVYASWNDFEWTHAKIASKTKEAGMYSVILEVGEDIVKEYKRPGQFVQVDMIKKGKAAFLAIASAPGTTTDTLELLIKPVEGSTAGDLCALDEGASVEVSPVMGKGFILDEVPGADTILIFATGSGISPIKALIEATPENGGLDAANKEDVRLYYGAQKKEAMAFKEKFDEWRAKGVTVIPVLSQEDVSVGKRYVQDVFIEQQGGPIEGDPETTAVVLCGQKEMVEAVKAMEAAAGIPPENFLTNF